MDGASLGNPGVAGCGGVVWDERDNWVAGFARKIRITSSFEAKLWGLWDGLTLCSNLNIYALIVELDAKAIVTQAFLESPHKHFVTQGRNFI